MTERMFVWFFGPSGAGRRYTIERVVAEPDHPIRSRIGLADPFVALESTLDGRYWPPIETVFEEIRELAQSNGSCLIKAQYPHLNDGAPIRLSGEFAEARHEIVLVWAEPRPAPPLPRTRMRRPDDGGRARRRAARPA